MARTPTASSIVRARNCPAAFSLPWVEESNPYSTHGTNVHAFLEQCAKEGVAASLAAACATLKSLEDQREKGADPGVLDELARKNLTAWANYQAKREIVLSNVPPQSLPVCESLDLTRLPLGRKFMHEAAFAFNVKTGESRFLGEGIGRNYPDLWGKDQVNGTADVVANVGTDKVFVGDYKSGGGGHDSVTAPAKVNDQMHFLALAACRAFKRKAAVVELIHLTQSGACWSDGAEYDEVEVDTFEVELKSIIERVHNFDPRNVPVYNCGVWCRYCGGFRFCPAKTAMLNDVARMLSLGTGELYARSGGNLVTLYKWFKQAEEVMEKFKGDLYGSIIENPQPLDDGRILGPIESTRRYLDGRITQNVLSEMVGTELAAKGVELKASGDSVKRALREFISYNPTKKLSIKKLVDEVYQKVAEKNGVTETTTVTVKPHKPDDEDGL